MISEEELQMQHTFALHQQNENNEEDDNAQRGESEATKLFVGQIPKDVSFRWLVILLLA